MGKTRNLGNLASGNNLISDNNKIGIGTTVATSTLTVVGDARITGILTVGTASITLDGAENQVNVGSGVTIHHTNGVQVGSNTLHSTGLTVNQLSVSGVVTATTFVGGVTGTASTASFATTSFGLTGTPNIIVGIITSTEFDITGSTNTLSASGLNVGVATAASFVGNLSGNVNSTGVSTFSTLRVGTAVTISGGIVTATSFRGDGSQLTGVGGAAAITVLTSNTTLAKGTAYMLNASGLVLTLPASPSTGDAINILNNVSGIHTLARNGSSIMSISEDMEFGEAGQEFKVWYTGSTWSLF